MMQQTAPLIAIASGGYEVSRFNAAKHGLLSRHLVLPWEDRSEYEALLQALIQEHAPSGPTETHLVEELAGIMWRKQRLALAEAAVYRAELHDGLNMAWKERRVIPRALAHLEIGQPTDHVTDAIRTTPELTLQDTTELTEDRALTGAALRLLRSGNPDIYDQAVAALHETTRAWWADRLADAQHGNADDEGDEPYRADAASLQQFLETEVAEWYATRETELANRPLIRAQALGETFEPNRLDKLARYETHLDRKLERTLAMLMRLQQLRADHAQRTD
jgi:hypothetical protein